MQLGQTVHNFIIIQVPTCLLWLTIKNKGTTCKVVGVLVNENPPTFPYLDANYATGSTTTTTFQPKYCWLFS